MEYTVQQAKTNLARLMAEAAQGHEVIITRGREHKPYMQLVPYRAKGGLKFGLYAKEMAGVDLDVLIGPHYTEEEQDEIDNNPLFPDEA